MRAPGMSVIASYWIEKLPGWAELWQYRSKLNPFNTHWLFFSLFGISGTGQPKSQPP